MKADIEQRFDKWTAVPGWRVEIYSPDRQYEWDEFVAQSRNGTFLLCRGYMDYHADRFTDCSLMIYYGRQLLTLLPGHLEGQTYCSHNGLTYGGLLLHPHITLVRVQAALVTACAFLQCHYNVTKLVYKAIPHIYHRYPAEDDLYVLTRLGARLAERCVSSVVRPEMALPLQELRRRQLKRARTCGLTWVEDDAFHLFWPLLEENLLRRHGVKPVHTLEEIERLHRSFPDRIRLFRVCEGTETVGGCVVYETDCVAHVQYIASSERGRHSGALDLLFTHLLTVRYRHVPYFDFGISTEQGGRILNEGLLFQKEGFGARSVVYDKYVLELDKPAAGERTKHD